MANGYEGLDNNAGGGSFMMGLLTGAALGAGLAMLLAPKAGSELRTQLSDRAGALANQARDGYRKATENAGHWAEKGKATAGEWAERGKDMYGKARDAAADGADEAHQYVRAAADTVTGAIAATAPAGSTGPSASSGPSSYDSGPSSRTSGAGGGSRRS